MCLDSPKTRYKPEVLCATEILALYELLEPSGEAAWIRHSAGAARLILLRTPESYTTDFERALFMGHTGPIMTEALLNGERCFLEQPAWQNLLLSIICKEEYYTISDRSEIVVHLIMTKSNIPGTFWDMTQILCAPRALPPRLHHADANLDAGTAHALPKLARAATGRFFSRRAPQQKAPWNTIAGPRRTRRS
ncbi:hypothetical protein DID88_008749 [Monilinia fructigena]|uniref:Uncharacterized protein n=1 Tax=Monilinia fructigena TaxID=38457 RepID=A0A395J6Y8_9HELO|nr:hypothetical protein DID88_008749 [Monilinia fructigena]